MLRERNGRSSAVPLLAGRRGRIAAVGVGLAAVLVVGTLPLIQNANAAPMMNDTFKSSMSGWSPVGGSWVVTKGTLRQTNARALNAMAFKGDTAWTDYTVSADVTIGGARGTTPGVAGVLARVAGNGRFARLTVGTNGVAKLEVVRVGRATTIGQATVTAGRHTLAIEAKGQGLRALVDGKVVASGTAAGLPATGRVGLIAHRAGAIFDNVMVAPIGGGSPPPPPTVPPRPTSTPSPTVTPRPTVTPSPTVPPSTPVTPTATATSAAPPPPSGSCSRPKGSAPVTRVTDVNLGTSVTGYGREGDTENLPMAIASTPSGASWLAWLGTDSKVYLGKLDCDDKLVGTPTSFAGIDLQDVAADANGGVVLLTRSGNQGSGTLCGGSSSPTKTMWMVRFDNSGKEVWATQVTNLTASRGGYDPGALFVWWYQHHGRLAYDGSNYAAYFGVAITVKNGNCVDIHEGDRMQVVGPNGALVQGKGSFDWGCSHAWQSRIVWDPAQNKFVMVCTTDNNCRIAQPEPYRTVAAGNCDGTLFGGDLVLASGRAGYWTAWSQGNAARLDHFTTGASTQTVNTGAKTQHPHLVTYSGNKMLLSWESGSQQAAQVYDANTGAKVGAEFTVGVRDHDFMAYKAYPDGSAAYPAAGSTGTSVKIARVMPIG